MGYGMWGGCCSGIFGSFGGFGLVGSILSLVITVGLIIGIVWLVIWIVRRLSSNQKTYLSQSGLPDNMKSPLDILKVRYARGEITRDEYQDMFTDLK
jgi:putative membrane protein